MLKLSSLCLDLTMNLSRLNLFLLSDLNKELEIGCGKGRFLIRRASRHPDVLFIGIDIAGKWLKKAEQLRIKKKLKNILFIRTEAYFLLNYILSAYGPAHFSKIHIYCPDPWPKKRHTKNRFFTPQSVIYQLYAHLKEQGKLSISTDHSDYYQLMQTRVRQASSLFGRIDWTNQRQFDPGNETAYAKKFLNMGKPMNYILCHK